MNIFTRITNRILELTRLFSLCAKYGSRFSYGSNVRFHKGLSVVMDKNSKLKLGNNFFARDFLYVRIESGEIIIGNDVFFNNFCSLNCLKSIQIDDNCVIGAGSVVYKNVPANSVLLSNGTVKRIIK